MQVEDLEYWMSKFVLEARKADGSEYPIRSCLLLQDSFEKVCNNNLMHTKVCIKLFKTAVM